MDAQNHHDYQRWLKELNFYEDQLIVFQKELNMVIEKHPDLFSIIEHVEEYQSIFQRKKKNIRRIQNQLMAKERVLHEAATELLIEAWNYDELEKAIRHFIVEMESLKRNFRRFISGQMK